MTDPMQEFQEARDQVVDVETDASGAGPTRPVPLGLPMGDRDLA